MTLDTSSRQEWQRRFEDWLRELLRAHLPPGTRVFLYGSRARGDASWNADVDLWVDAHLDASTRRRLEEAIEESRVPFRVDIVTTDQLRGTFGANVRRDAVLWLS